MLISPLKLSNRSYYMKNATLFVVFLMLTGLILSSCYTYSIDYGDGPQKYVETVKKNNHYFLWGLVDNKVEPPAKPISGTEDYRMTTEHTFLDGLLRTITFGIYTPTTTVIME